MHIKKGAEAWSERIPADAQVGAQFQGKGEKRSAPGRMGQCSGSEEHWVRPDIGGRDGVSQPFILRRALR